MCELEISALYVKWKVNNATDKHNKIIDSSSFLFQDSQWKLRYTFYDDHHLLCLLRVTDDRSFAPFVWTVHVVVSSTGKILPQLSKSKRIEEDPIKYCSWWQSDSDIVESDPSFRETSDLHFLVVLKVDDALTANISAETPWPCTSTSGQRVLSNCSSLESVRPETLRPTTSTSVQTVLNISNDPCLGSLSEDLSKLLLDKDSNSDVEFRCADNSTKAHRVIVSARSPVIASMLSRDMLEQKTGEVNIPNMKHDTLKRFLRYIYSGRLDELTFDTALNLYEAGDQYAVLGLAKRCSKFLMEQLTAANACDVLVVADAHSDADFVEAVIVFMLDKKVPLSGERWEALCKGHPLLASKIVNRYVEKLLI